MSAVRFTDERYLFHLRPWVYFPLYLGAGVALPWLLDGAPVWLHIVIAAPIGWTLPFYITRMLFFVRCSEWSRSAASRWGGGRPDERSHQDACPSVPARASSCPAGRHGGPRVRGDLRT